MPPHTRRLVIEIIDVSSVWTNLFAFLSTCLCVKELWHFALTHTRCGSELQRDKAQVICFHFDLAARLPWQLRQRCTCTDHRLGGRRSKGARKSMAHVGETRSDVEKTKKVKWNARLFYVQPCQIFQDFVQLKQRLLSKIVYSWMKMYWLNHLWFKDCFWSGLFRKSQLYKSGQTAECVMFLLRFGSLRFVWNSQLSAHLQLVLLRINRL